MILSFPPRYPTICFANSLFVIIFSLYLSFDQYLGLYFIVFLHSTLLPERTLLCTPGGVRTLKFFSIRGYYLGVPCKGILLITFPTAFATIIKVYINNTISFIHCQWSTGYNINDSPHRITKYFYPINHCFLHLSDM